MSNGEILNSEILVDQRNQIIVAGRSPFFPSIGYTPDAVVGRLYGRPLQGLHLEAYSDNLACIANREGAVKAGTKCKINFMSTNSVHN